MLLLCTIAVYFFADVLIMFGIRLLTFALCGLVAIYLFKLIAVFLLWLGLGGQEAWASLIAGLLVGLLACFAIRSIAIRVAIAAESGGLSGIETVSLDSVRTGLISAFSVLICQATLAASTGEIYGIPWMAIVILVVIMTCLDVVFPQLLHRLSTTILHY